jgi:glucose 1-dehydrogenase
MAKVLQDKIAIVTGSDSRIGQATAEEFAKEGADVVVTCFRDQDGAEETRRRVEAAGRRARSAADRALAQPAGPGAAASSASTRRPPGGFAVFARHHPALRQIPGRHPLPAPLSWAQFEAFLRETGADRHTGVTIRDG